MIDIARDNLIDLAEVAKRLKVKSQTVRNWVKAGSLDAVRVGGRWYTNAECLNAMAKHAPKTTPMPQKPSLLSEALARSDAQSLANIQAMLGRTG